MRLFFTLRLVLRLAAILALAVALWLAVLDATRSIAAEAWTVTPLAETWARFWPEGFARFEAWMAAGLPPALRDHVVLPVLGFPGWAVLAGAAVLLGLCGAQGEAAEIGGPAARPD